MYINVSVSYFILFAIKLAGDDSMQQRERLSVELPVVLERFLVHSFSFFRLVRFATNNVAFTERYRLDTTGYRWDHKKKEGKWFSKFIFFSKEQSRFALFMIFCFKASLATGVKINTFFLSYVMIRNDLI